MIRSTPGFPHLIHLIKPRVLFDLIVSQEHLPFSLNLFYGAKVIQKNPEWHPSVYHCEHCALGSPQYAIRIAYAVNSATPH